MKKNKIGMMIVAACFLSSGLAMAEEQHAAAEKVVEAGKDLAKQLIAEQAPATQETAQAPAAAPAMDPAQMEKMKAVMAPSEAHKMFEGLVGKWNYTAKFWMAAEGKPEETTGTSDNSLIYGGRFLKQDIKGTWMGQPFEGQGFVGYDNTRAQYESVWIDSMSTGIMWVSGQFDGATKTLGMAGKNSCPLSGEKERACRADWKVVDANQTVYSSYTNGPDGKEFKAMEIVYTRAA